MFWWYLTRASGIVATVLFGLSLTWGLFFTSRSTGRRPKPNWWLDLHNMLGGLSLAFTVVHVLAVIIDPNAGFSLVQALVPGLASDLTLAMAYGIVATYVLLALVATSWPELRFRRSVWRAIHLVSIPAAVLTALHAYQTGSDRSALAFQAMIVTLFAAIVYAGALRTLSIRRRRGKKKERGSRRTLTHE